MLVLHKIDGLKKNVLLNKIHTTFDLKSLENNQNLTFYRQSANSGKLRMIDISLSIYLFDSTYHIIAYHAIMFIRLRKRKCIQY